MSYKDQSKFKTSIGILKLLSLFFLLFTSCIKQKNPVAERPNKPNVVFILADDLGANDLGFAGSAYYETPNIDAIAKSGAIFTNGYASAQVCSPSRASIMLGQYTARHGITDWIGAASGTDWQKKGRNTKLLPPEYTHALPKPDTTLAEAMLNGGYKTFFAGKWHLGGEGSYPEDHGFEINKGGWEVGSPKGGYFSPWQNPSLPNKIDGENLSMRLAKETIDFIKENKDESFFAFLSFYAVHGPIQTTEEKWKKYRNKAERIGIAENGYTKERILPIRTVQDNPIYAGLVESMDDAVGYVLNSLKEMGLDEDTIIIFTSDNGGVASGDAFSTTNLPLRGGKGYQWEGGIREPYLIKVPWLDHSGQEIDYPVTGTDFFPTILDLVGMEKLPRQHNDGKSLKPILEGKNMPERPIYWHYPHYGNQGGEPVSIIREGNWKLIHYWEDNRNELYNLTDDLGEQNDASKANEQITKSLITKLMNFLQDTGANLPEQDLKFSADKAKEILEQRRNVLLPNLEAQRKKFLSSSFKPNEDWWNSKTTKD